MSSRIHHSSHSLAVRSLPSRSGDGTKENRGLLWRAEAGERKQWLAISPKNALSHRLRAWHQRDWRCRGGVGFHEGGWRGTIFLQKSVTFSLAENGHEGWREGFATRAASLAASDARDQRPPWTDGREGVTSVH